MSKYNVFANKAIIIFSDSETSTVVFTNKAPTNIDGCAYENLSLPPTSGFPQVEKAPKNSGCDVRTHAQRGGMNTPTLLCGFLEL